MPIQILERERPDAAGRTSATQGLQEAIQFKQELAYKKSVVDYQIQQLGVQVKEASTEESKLKLEQQKFALEKLKSLLTISDKIEDPETKKRFLATYGAQGAADGTFKDALDNPAIQEILSNASPSKETQEARSTGALADIRGYIRDQIGSQIPEGDIGAEGEAPIAGNSRAQAVSGEMQPTRGSGWQLSPEMDLGDGLKVVNAEARNRMIGDEVRARKGAEREEELQPLRASVRGYNEVFEQAIKEFGGLSSTGAGAAIRGTGAQVWSRIGNMPATAALQDITKSLVLQLASFANRGRPTDKDAEAMAGTLMKLTATEGSNAILRKYLDTVLASGDPAMADKIFTTLQSNKKNPNPTFTEQRFSIRVKE